MKARIKVNVLPGAPQPTRPMRVDKYGKEIIIRRFDELPEWQKEVVKPKSKQEPWTEYEILTVKRLRANGYTVQQIADDLGRTRASVKSEIRRMMDRGIIARKRKI